MWSPLADITSRENLEASQEFIPFPTGKEIQITVDNKKESFFTTYDEHIYDVFDIETETTKDQGLVTPLNEQGFRILKLKDNPHTPEQIKALGYLLKVADSLNIKGELQSDGSWKPNEAFKEEWEQGRVLYDESGKKQTGLNSLQLLGFKTPEACYNALQQIKAILDEHQLYVRHADNRTREQMAKNQCQWAMYQICSTPSNLVELMVGVDQSTDPIKNKKNGAVAQSPYNGDDKQAAPGNYDTIHKSFQEGQVGKDCVGIGAVSIKVNSTTQYYMDDRLQNGTDSELMRLLFPQVDKYGNRDANGKRGYTIGGKTYYSLINLYDKLSESQETESYTREDGSVVQVRKNLPDEIKKVLAEQEFPEGYTPNVAMSLAAMLSVAVDSGQFY